MATFAITTSVNIDTLAAKTGSDTYNINGGYLTVDQDSRYGTNNNTSAAMGNITMSATLGGTIEFTGVNVRLIPYNTGTGNVPASNTTISQGSASGLLIGVYSALTAAPTAAGAAMPASGFIKIKQWNSVAFAAGALSGIGATATGADTVGWIEIVGVDALTATVNRLNTFKVRGAWYSLGTTTGANTDTYQIPSNGSIVYCPGVWVETSVGSGQYEFYPCAGSLTATSANVATDFRGKCCWISTAGVVRFQHDGTNNTGGFLPTAGLNIRIPNVLFMCCTAATPTANVLPNATLATRYDFTTTGGGVIDIDIAAMNWYASFTQPYSVSLTNFCTMSQLLVQEIASSIAWNQVGVGQEAATAAFGLSMTLCFAGGTVSDSTFTSATLAASGRYVLSLTDVSNVVWTRVKLFSFVARGNATTGCATLTRVANCTFNSCTHGLGRFLLTTCTGLTFNNTVYFDTAVSTTTTSNPMFAFDLATACSSIKIDGLSFGGLNLVQPYSGILNVGTAGCTSVKLRNLGSKTGSLDLGGSQRDGQSWSRVTTTATVTSSVAHGLKTGDIVYVLQCSDTTPIPVGSKTLTAAPSTTQFQFAATNSGGTNGTLTYYPTMSANLFVLVAGAASNNVEVKRCYTPHTRTNLYTSDNSHKNITLENVQGDYINAPVTPILNGYHKSVYATLPYTAQTSCYGTHWFDHFVCDPIGPITASWSRVTTTATVTSSIVHNKRTGLLITVLSSSQSGAINLGSKTITAASTPLSTSFTFTCTNTGATNGNLVFESQSGRIGLLMNESTSDTSSQYSVTTGSASFTSAGGLYMPTSGTIIEFTSPYYFLGHANFPMVQPVMAGASSINNYEITYQMDKNDGLGFSGSYKNLSFIVPSGSAGVDSTSISMLSTNGVSVGDYVWGTNVAQGSKVTQITNSTTVVVDQKTTGTVSGDLQFNYLPSELSSSINPSNGFKMKIRFKTRVPNVTAITSFYFITNSTTGSRQAEYPLDLLPLTLTNLRNPSEVRVYNYNTRTEITGQEDVTSGTFTANIDATTYPTVDISVLSLGYQNTRYLSQSLGSSGLTIPVSQVIDRQYLNS
jgi:hypothetical protein